MSRFAISGVTVSGNLGGQAMLLTTLQQLRRIRSRPRFSLLSVFPAADRRLGAPADVEVLDGTAGRLVLCYVPLAILASPFRRMPWVRRWLARVAYFRGLMGAEALLDHSGIAFSDSRGIAVLAYNTMSCLPGILLGVPVVKLPQALGPFREPLNRAAARFVLRRCARVFARGSLSAQYLGELGDVRYEQQPDVSFALQVPADAHEAARARLALLGLGERLVVLAPSRVVQRYCQRAQIDLLAALERLVRDLTGLGYQVLVFAHSHGTSRSSNNDAPMCEELARRCGSHAKLVTDVLDAAAARAIIGRARIFVGSRFHAVVAALSMGVPALAVGWSHKYVELLAEFGLEAYALRYQEISAPALLERFRAVEADCDWLRGRIAGTAQTLATRVRDMYTTAFAAGAG